MVGRARRVNRRDEHLHACHPHYLTRPSIASVGTASALLRELAGLGDMMRREAGSGFAADNLLTGSESDGDAKHAGEAPTPLASQRQ
jgi:hypothetical protein